MIRVPMILLWVIFNLLANLSVLPAEERDEATKASGYTGSEKCLECHGGRALSGPHSATTNPDSPSGPDQLGCETCHGPGGRHARAEEEDSGSAEAAALIKDLGPKSDMPVEERNALCTQCHNNSYPLWQGSTHESREVGCTNCHSPHARNRKYLAKSAEPELCSECHKDIRADLMKNSHHPLREGKITCSDCHNPHGAVADKLITANYINEKCYECHAEKRGPFLWEHEPVREDCLTCHTPHGSSHDKLLKQKVPFLCQDCHSNSRHPGTLYSVPQNAPNRSAYVTLGNRAYYRSCQNCHQMIHGSNHPSGQSLSR